MAQTPTYKVPQAQWSRLARDAEVKPTSVRETTTTTGTGALTLGGAVAGFQTAASVYKNGDVFDGAVTDGVNWERGLYTLKSGTILRSLVLRSTNNNLAVNFGAGTKLFIANVPDTPLALLALLHEYVLSSASTLKSTVTASSLTSVGTLASLIVSGALTLGGLLDISGAAAGQIKFPATQNASADANTLDDHEKGTWTPVLTFGVPGNLAVTYSTQTGLYTKTGRGITISWMVNCSVFTHTTATGNWIITGVPFTALTLTGHAWRGAFTFQGVTKAGFTQFTPRISSAATNIQTQASGTGVAIALVTAPDIPTGGTPSHLGTLTYDAA